MFGWEDMNNDLLTSIAEDGKLKLPEFTRSTKKEELLVIPFEDHLCLCGVRQLARRYERLVKKATLPYQYRQLEMVKNLFSNALPGSITVDEDKYITLDKEHLKQYDIDFGDVVYLKGKYFYLDIYNKNYIFSDSNWVRNQYTSDGISRTKKQ